MVQNEHNGVNNIVVLLMLSTAFFTTANAVPTKTKSGPWTIMSNGAKSVHSSNEMVQMFMKFFMKNWSKK